MITPRVRHPIFRLAELDLLPDGTPPGNNTSPPNLRNLPPILRTLWRTLGSWRFTWEHINPSRPSPTISSTLHFHFQLSTNFFADDGQVNPPPSFDGLVSHTSSISLIDLLFWHTLPQPFTTSTLPPPIDHHLHLSMRAIHMTSVSIMMSMKHVLPP